jgi:hypothetical protein
MTNMTDDEFNVPEDFQEMLDRLHAKQAAQALEQEEKTQQLIDEGITGTLRNAYFNTYKSDIRYPNIAGRVDIDTKGRFGYNYLIFTSRLEKIYVKHGRTFAKTGYSLYELIDFDPETIPEDFRYAYQEI